MSARHMATASALPDARISSAISGVLMPPMAVTGILTPDFFTASAYLTLQPLGR